MNASIGPKRMNRRLDAGIAALVKSGRGHNLLIAVLGFTTIVAGVGLTVHPRLLLLLPAAGFVLLIGIVWPWLCILTVRGELSLQADRIYEGETIDAALAVRQRGPWPIWGLRLDVDEHTRETLDPIRPLSSATLELQLRPQRRGTYPPTSPSWRTGFPFGLVTASREVTLRTAAKVWPRVLPVAAIPEWAYADLAVGRVETRRVGSDGDTIGVREYRRGDPMRWIHWPQTARHDRFMVREFQASGVPRIGILLDCNPEAHVGSGPDSSFEWSVRIAASVASGWLKQGAEVGLIAGAIRVAPAGGDHQRIQLLDALADVQLLDVPQAIPAPHGDAPSLLISTELGWAGASTRGTRLTYGYLLDSAGFGGPSRASEVRSGAAIAIKRPSDVAPTLRGTSVGLTDVA